MWQELDTVGPYGTYRGAEVAPDGARVAVHRHDVTGGDVWVIEPPPRGVRRLTFEPSTTTRCRSGRPTGTRGLPLNMNPLTIETAVLTAPRPRYCALSTAKLAAAGIVMPPWQDALRRYLSLP